MGHGLGGRAFSRYHDGIPAPGVLLLFMINNQTCLTWVRSIDWEGRAEQLGLAVVMMFGTALTLYLLGLI
jgi:hypothetical protein